MRKQNILRAASKSDTYKCIVNIRLEKKLTAYFAFSSKNAAKKFDISQINSSLSKGKRIKLFK
jgi:hypothetical protein